MLLVPEDRAAGDTESLGSSPLGTDGETKAEGDKAVTQQDGNRGAIRAPPQGLLAPRVPSPQCSLVTWPLQAALRKALGKGKVSF